MGQGEGGCGNPEPASKREGGRPHITGTPAHHHSMARRVSNATGDVGSKMGAVVLGGVCVHGILHVGYTRVFKPIVTLSLRHR